MYYRLGTSILTALLLFAVGLSTPVFGQDAEVPYEFEASFSIVEGSDFGKLDVTLTAADGWHGYSQKELDGQTPTEIVPGKVPGIKSIGKFVAQQAPVRKNVPDLGPVEQFDEHRVTWSAEIELEKETNFEELEIPVTIEGQVCEESRCVQFGDGHNEVVAKFKELITKKQVEESQESKVEPITPSELSIYLVMAFFAGLILNAMPCVLPVIGLKVLSFVKQAAENRFKIFMLNLAFAGGLMLVFLIIATLAAFFGMGWGDWLTKSITGSMIITSIVFAFGLSMLGVWEIPIPGLSTSGKEEGLSGAFLLGILTTILATPCTGPLLVPATAVVAGQPVWVAYAIFTFIGLGMAIPYLLIGIFPALIKWLPKPGPWMDTFKQITGFILIGTVVFLLAGYGSEPHSKYLVPIMTILLSIGFGCWWIGTSSYATDAKKRRMGWVWGLGIIATGTLVSYLFLGPPLYELEWKSFSVAEIERYHDEDRVVFVDFTGPS